MIAQTVTAVAAVSWGSLTSSGWLTDSDKVDYEVAKRDEPYKGMEVSRKGVAALVVDLVTGPGTRSRAGLGLDKPGTAVDRSPLMWVHGPPEGGPFLISEVTCTRTARRATSPGRMPRCSAGP